MTGSGTEPDGRLPGVVERTSAWARRHGGPVPVVADRQVHAACTFAVHCAPEHVTPRGLDVASRLLVAFLSIDDADPAEVRSLLGGGGPDGPLGCPPLLRAWIDQFDEMAAAAPRLRSALEASLRDYLRARLDEVELAGTIDSVERAWALRARTIFTAPYLDHWLVSLGIDDESVFAAPFLELRRLATELTFLFNDLGSLGEDGGDDSASVSILDVLRRSRGWSLERATDHLVAVHDDIAARYGALLAEMRAGREPPAPREVELLARVITHGNRRAHAELLGSRYSATAAMVLGRLAIPAR